jgi:hypothetical protein
MKKLKLFFIGAFLLAISSAFITKVSSTSQIGNNADGNMCVSGTIDNTSNTCTTSGTDVCRFRYNGADVEAYQTCTPGTPPTLSGLLKHD